MKFVRFSVKDQPPAYGWIVEEKVGLIEGNPFGEFRRMETNYDLDSVHLLPPVEPSKVVCVGRNYAEHAKEEGNPVPETPIIFLKPPSAVIGVGDEIRLPPQSNQVEHEAELVIVIGKTGSWIPIDRVREYIFGFTAGNDVTARDLQRKDSQWTRGKGFDTFCPIGPWIETELDVSDALVTCRVNGELRQMGSTREMVFSIPQLVTYISSVMTLFPGDLIFTGTPAGVGPLEENDEVDVEIEGIGHLRNRVTKPPTSMY